MLEWDVFEASWGPIFADWGDTFPEDFLQEDPFYRTLFKIVKVARMSNIKLFFHGLVLL